MRVLVVEDHDETRDLVSRALLRDGHLVTTAGSLAAARAALAERAADVVVLDLGLPDGDGLSLCRALRDEGSGVPVLVLTAQGAVARRVEGLDAGADDFLAKPFALAELRARVRALGRRGPLPRGLTVQAGDVTLDLAARRARSRTAGESGGVTAGVDVPLTAREWAVIDLLAARRGRVVPRGEILEAVWGEATDATSASLDVIVARIRRKLGVGALRTLRGEGYSLGGS